MYHDDKATINGFGAVLAPFLCRESCEHSAKVPLPTHFFDQCFLSSVALSKSLCRVELCKVLQALNKERASTSDKHFEGVFLS